MKITLIKGDGIGPEITASMTEVVDVLKIDLEFEEMKTSQR